MEGRALLALSITPRRPATPEVYPPTTTKNAVLIPVLIHKLLKRQSSTHTSVLNARSLGITTTSVLNARSLGTTEISNLNT